MPWPRAPGLASRECIESILSTATVSVTISMRRDSCVNYLLCYIELPPQFDHCYMICNEDLSFPRAVLCSILKCTAWCSTAYCKSTALQSVLCSDFQYAWYCKYCKSPFIRPMQYLPCTAPHHGSTENLLHPAVKPEFAVLFSTITSAVLQFAVTANLQYCTLQLLHTASTATCSTFAVCSTAICSTLQYAVTAICSTCSMQYCKPQWLVPRRNTAPGAASRMLPGRAAWSLAHGDGQR